jgi:hypothetical protein
MFDSVKARTGREGSLPTEMLLGTLKRADSVRITYPTGENVVDVFWRTLLVGRDSKEGIIPSRWMNLASTIFLHPEYLEHGSEQIISWYQTNKDFQIYGYRMEGLVEAHHIAGNTLGQTEFALWQKILRTLRKRCEERELLTSYNERRLLGPEPEK